MDCDKAKIRRLTLVAEALRAIAQQHDDEDAPFVADARQYRTDGTAILACGIGKLDGHLGVLRYQICAFLSSLARLLT